MKYAYIIDFSNWNYKFLSTLSISRNLSGVEVNVSALFGWYRAMKNLIFQDVFICLDGVPSLSRGWLPTYKGQRDKENTEGVGISYLTIIELLCSLGKFLNKNIHVCFVPGQEADQVMSSICHLVTNHIPKNAKILSRINNSMYPIEKDKYIRTFKSLPYRTLELDKFDGAIVASTDSDLTQLREITNVISDYSLSGKELIYGEAPTPKMTHYLPPSCIPAYKMINGDVSDNVPKLNTSFKLDELLDLIKQELNSSEKCEEFLKELKQGVNVRTGRMHTLFDDLQPQVKQADINFKVTHLIYYSTPFEFESLDKADYILSKYHIRK